MVNNLRQEQLNASILIDALARINAINTDPKYGWGKDTLELIQNHIKTWDHHSKKELIENFVRITENLILEWEIKIVPKNMNKLNQVSKLDNKLNQVSNLDKEQETLGRLALLLDDINLFNIKVAAALADRSLQTTSNQHVSFYADINLNIVELKLHPFNGKYAEKPIAYIRYHINREKKVIRTRINTL